MMSIVSRSMKSGSDTKNRTELTVLPVLDVDDAKLMYQAYRLNQLPKGWKAQQNLKPTEFIESLDDFIKAHYDLNWSIRDGNQPILILFGKDVERFLILGDVVWWPKTSDRRKVEAVTAVLNEIRKDRVGLIEAEYEYKKFYEILCNHKILRRVGSLYDTIEKNSRTTFFQTRAI